MKPKDFMTDWFFDFSIPHLVELSVTNEYPSKKDINKITRPIFNNTVPGIRHVQFNEETGHTTIVWDDDTSTTVSCAEGASFEKYSGFCAAVAKKVFGSTNAVRRLIEEKDVDAARQAKEKAREERIQRQREMELANHERAVRREARRKLFEEEVTAMVETMKKEREANGR